MARVEYAPKMIEKKWQEFWDENKTFHASYAKDKEKYYVLIEFPYPSGEGLHVGHPRSYTAFDMVARKKRLDGYNVLYPIGWDAFGLPTENYAIQKKIHPRLVTQKNIARFKKQLKSLGYSFDWSREINTTDPDYYRWTQWIFLQFYKNGLAYKDEIPINWCVQCKIGLANEEVVDGVCERCGGEVIPKVKEQWILRITDYAERLLEDLDKVDYLEQIKAQQVNWIGRSEGMEVDFRLKDYKEKIKVFTTRPDTLFGATYMVLAPEHPLLASLLPEVENRDEVVKYREKATKRSEFDRMQLGDSKTGVPLQGIKAINPANREEIPVWVADYVLMTYGTGAIMAVPAHDTRDWEFAKKYDLPIIEVIEGGNIEEKAYTDVENGILVNSDFINGLSVPAAIEKMGKWLEKERLGERKVNFKLRDWVFSRQRYWGEPIPLIHCDKCGWVPVPEEELPVTLPDVEVYQPTDTGESPLAAIEEWVMTTCPKCGGPGRRETDTMPNWAGSSWYFMRYLDPHNSLAPAAKAELDYWLPVDWYNGGMEHTTLHLLYSRFWYKFLYDIGLVSTPEPYKKRTSHAMILGENNEKMSKSRGNVITPDSFVEEFGADTFRVYMVFIGAFDQDVPWSNQGVIGCRRFLDRVWRLQEFLVEGEGYSPDMMKKMHRTVKKVSEDIERMKFNTAIAALMALTNDFYRLKKITAEEIKTLLLLLNPAAPHITEELWQQLGFPGYLHQAAWPTYDEDKIMEDVIEIAVQVNGRLRGTVNIAMGAEQEKVREKIAADEGIMKYIDGKEIRKEIYIPDRIYNFVVK